METALLMHWSECSTELSHTYGVSFIMAGPLWAYLREISFDISSFGGDWSEIEK